MAPLNKEAILAAVDRKFVDVEVAEWGGSVRLGSMNAEERLEYEEIIQANGTNRNHSMGAMLVRSIRDESGERLFTDEDIAALSRKDPRILLDLYKRAADLNVLSEKSAEQTKGE